MPKPKAPPAEVLEALRANTRLVHELAVRYGIDPIAPRTADRPKINHPRDVYVLLAPEMAACPQEQLRVLLLDTKTGVIGQRTIYQGNVNSSQIRAAPVLHAAIGSP